MRRLLMLSLLANVAACDLDPAPPTSDLSLLATASTIAAPPLPRTRAEFLAVMAPLPFAAVHIEYDVHGPGGLLGTLEVLVAPGGLRREHWSIELPVPDNKVRMIESSAVQTPDVAWAGQGDSLGVESAPLGALADAYLKLEPDLQQRVVDSLRRFRQRVAAARAQTPGPSRAVLGVPCLQTRLAAQELCIWEETGLPLETKGNAFGLTARRIDTDPEVGDDAFDVPAAVRRRAEPVAVDAAASLARLADEDYADLGPLLHPGLRLPVG